DVTATNEGAPYATFFLRLDAPSSLPVSVRFAAVSGGPAPPPGPNVTYPTPAIAGQDFVGTNGFITFPPNITNAEVRVPIIDDNLFEARTNAPQEYFGLQLSSPTNASLGTALANGWIL